jgi:hypothetical protein
MRPFVLIYPMAKPKGGGYPSVYILPLVNKGTLHRQSGASLTGDMRTCPLTFQSGGIISNAPTFMHILYDMTLKGERRRDEKKLT